MLDCAEEFQQAAVHSLPCLEVSAMGFVVSIAPFTVGFVVEGIFWSKVITLWLWG